jgi:hypothetical protein
MSEVLVEKIKVIKIEREGTCYGCEFFKTAY